MGFDEMPVPKLEGGRRSHRINSPCRDDVTPDGGWAMR
jgi:hypothetical protein